MEHVARSIEQISSPAVSIIVSAEWKYAFIDALKDQDIDQLLSDGRFLEHGIDIMSLYPKMRQVASSFENQLSELRHIRTQKKEWEERYQKRIHVFTEDAWDRRQKPVTPLPGNPAVISHDQM
ncbi:MAG: hypothetical protein ACOCWQ_03755 [Nanoarchaeota archaeon]